MILRTQLNVSVKSQLRISYLHVVILIKLEFGDIASITFSVLSARHFKIIKYRFKIFKKMFRV